MLAQHYNVQIVLTSCETLRCSTYSADAPTASVFVLYTGQHYDPLVGQPAASDAGASPLRRLPLDAGVCLAASAIEIARAHNAEAERRKLERRVKRIKCGGCGAIVADNAAFQAHCTEVEHDDDFTYECEQVELVLGQGDELPDGHVDLESEGVHAFYNALSSEALSLSMRCTLAPFELDGKRYPTLEAAITADAVADLPSSEQRAAAVLSAVRAQYASEAAEGSGLAAHLLATGDKLLACVDLNPWLGIQAGDGISTGENRLGKALMAVRDELRAARG
mmetsp:Transcript_18129/g.60833  ORF Transcript_18129/g.60833 Transcript_18129/m.60833 type:complete len:279 (-) Transcript_18129:208-1044(-)